MKSKPFIIKSDKTGAALVRIPSDKKQFAESWLQELLQNHPQILPVDEIEPVFWPLIPIGREISTRVGYIDNLFISKAGYPVIVETKLWRNSEAKREVIAQTIDYASELSKWSFEQLDHETRRINKKGILELMQAGFDPDPDEIPTEDAIVKNLRLGRFLILIVSDHIRSSLVEMLNYVNRYPHLATNVGLVELQCYFMPDNPDDILVVPAIVAKTEIIERSIVQVNILPEVAHTVSVEQLKSEPDGDGGRALSEDAYWEALKKNSPASVAPAKKILDHFGPPDIVLKMRRTAVVARMNLPDSDQRVSLFFIGVDGSLNCWPSTITSQLKNAGLDQALGIDYEKELGKVLKHKSKKLSIYDPIEKVDVDAFILIVDNFIDKLLKTEIPAED